MHGVFDTKFHTSSGRVEEMSDTQTFSAPDSVEHESPISLEETNTRRGPAKKEVSSKRTNWNPWVFTAIMVGLLAPLLVPTLAKFDLKGQESQELVKPAESNPSEAVKVAQKNETQAAYKDEPYVIERFYDVPKLDEEEVAKLHSIQEDMMKAVIECEKAFHKSFDETKYKAALKDALDDATEGVFEAISIPDSSYNDFDGEVEDFKDYIWETNIKAGIEAFNEPLITAAIRSLQQLALFSKKVIPESAEELIQISHSFKIRKTATIGIDCPAALYIPDISANVYKWNTANEKSSEEVRHKVHILERYSTELTELLFKASKSMDKLASVYLNSVGYYLTPDAEIHDLLHTTDYYN